jgi:hypothetical protein
MLKDEKMSSKVKNFWKEKRNWGGLNTSLHEPSHLIKA